MPSTSARLDPIRRTTGEPTTENAVNDVYSSPSDIDPRLPSCVPAFAAGSNQSINSPAAPWGIPGMGCAYRVHGALEVLGGVVGEEDEEEGRAQEVRVAGLRSCARAVAGGRD